MQLLTTKFCPWTNIVWKNVLRPDVVRTDVARIDVAWTNVAWTNGTGPLVNSQGWFHKLEMSSRVLSLGVGGLGKVEIYANSVQLCWSWD